MNAVDICNLALAYIGQGANNPIEAVDGTDTSEAGAACALHYPQTLAALVRNPRVRWPFLRVTAPLAPIADLTVPGWAYAYAWPNDAAALVALCDAGTDPWREPASRSAVQYAVQRHADTATRLVATDLPLAYAAFVHMPAVEDEIEDPLFVEALAWTLAAKLALTLKADPQIARMAQQTAVGARSDAIAAALREGNAGREPDADSMAQRLGVPGDAWSPR